MSNPEDNARKEIEKVTEKIRDFMKGTQWGCLSIYFRYGKIQKYEETKTEITEERKEKC